MKIMEDQPLQGLTTFRLPARARYFARVRDLEELREALAFARRGDRPVLILGGGSNTVLTRNFPGLVIRVELPGLERIDGDGEEPCLLRVGAGEDWPRLVERCLAQGLFGLENLAWIPGTAGAAPVQNIGAYGVELADRLQAVEALDRTTGELVHLDKQDCRFSYRSSLFKEDRLRDRYVITSIVLVLSKIPAPILTHTALKEELASISMGSGEVTPLEVSRAVRRLRRRKLPDPAELGNVGSFFRNPVVSATVYRDLKARFEGLVGYPEPSGDRVKLAAAWMIERLGWRGARRGSVGVHTEHALILVNHGTATGEEVMALAREIQRSVEETFGVTLEIEPAVY